MMKYIFSKEVIFTTTIASKLDFETKPNKKKYFYYWINDKKNDLDVIISKINK